MLLTAANTAEVADVGLVVIQLFLVLTTLPFMAPCTAADGGAKVADVGLACFMPNDYLSTRALLAPGPGRCVPHLAF